MKTQTILAAFAVLAAHAFGAHATRAFAAQTAPNVLLIMADDMGYSDLGCMGSEIKTPNLDQLAKNGILFTQAYNTAKCYPTRASLLTGVYFQQTNQDFRQDNDAGRNAETGGLQHVMDG